MRTARGEATRRRILSAARDELVCCGGAMEFAAVAKRAGVSAGLPYRYFASKSALLVALVDEFFDDWESVAYRPTFAHISDDWWVCEQTRLEKTVDFFYTHPLGPFVFTHLAGDADVMAGIRERLNRQIRGAAGNIATGQQHKRVPKHIDAELCGALLMGGVYQAITQALSTQPRMPRERILRELQHFMQRVLCIEEIDDGPRQRD